MPEWLNILLAILGGAVTTGVPLLLYVWRQANAIQREREREDYEMDKIRRSDFGREMTAIVAELKADAQRQDAKFEAQSKQIQLLHEENIACNRKSAMQEAEIYKHKSMIEFLESRVKNLEASAVPPLSAVANHGATMAAAVKEVAKEAMKENALVENPKP